MTEPSSGHTCPERPAGTPGDLERHAGGSRCSQGLSQLPLDAMSSGRKPYASLSITGR